MSTGDSFVEFLKEQLAPLGQISVRCMFGGAGIYCDGVMFALLDDTTLYFKTDETNRPDFEAEGLGPFTYETKHGRNTIMSYWRVPERLFDESDAMLTWSRKAFIAASRSKSKPRGKRKR
jgi:DNA transformation protein and related proteins